MLGEIELDDIRFQELVSEARTRIVRHSPDWTEHNVSDPGITLIELFAWLTELLVYRINRIPERLQFGLLELVGVRPVPPQCATTTLRFLLQEPGSGGRVPPGTEVASPRTAGSDSVVFQTTEELVIPPDCPLAGYGVQHGGSVTVEPVTGGSARPAGALQAPFGAPASVGDALLVGFDTPPAGLVLRLDIRSSRAYAPRLDPADPPLAWEVLTADGEWSPAAVIADETGGFLLGDGSVTLQIPEAARGGELGGLHRHWLRCRVAEKAAHGVPATYARPPEITEIRAVVAGATVAARHGATVVEELIGTADGIAGTVYPLRRRPVLPLEPGETLEVRAPGDGWAQWQPVDSFERSTRSDRHFTLDTTRGEIRFGPAIRQPDGGWRRYGAVPPAGSALRMSRYRHGGGAEGNVAARALTILPRPVPGIAAATNSVAASGGTEPESLHDACERARLEMRSRTRAVTSEDFERLTLAASPRVARAVCVGPEGAGAVRVHVLPRIEAPDRQLSIDELVPDAALMTSLAAELEPYRLLGTSLRLLPVKLRGVSIVAEVRISARADPERVQHDVAHALYVFLNPLVGGDATGPSNGWGVGRAVNQGELFGIAYRIAGVEFVNILRMYETDLRTGQQAPQPTESRLVLEPDELVASGRHIIKAVHRG